jgi:hypothetical protein
VEKEKKGGMYMNGKILEIRDSATFIPVVAFAIRTNNESEKYLLRRVGYPDNVDVIVVFRLDTHESRVYPYDWGGSRTMTVAHDYIVRNWEKVRAGDVVDVEYILGLSPQPKKPERLEYGMRY